VRLLRVPGLKKMSILGRQIALGRFQGSVSGRAEWRHTAINSLGNKPLGVLYGLSATDGWGWNVPLLSKSEGRNVSYTENLK